MNKLNLKLKPSDAQSEQKTSWQQRMITALALLLLLLAVQISTQNVGDWFVFGLNVLEVSQPHPETINVVTNVCIDLSDRSPEIVQRIVMKLFEYTLG